MPSVEDRVTVLEARRHEQAAVIAEIRGGFAEVLREIRRDMERRFQQVHQCFQHVDQRFQQLDQRFQQVDQRFQQVDQRFQQVDQRFTEMDRRFDETYRRFNDVDRRLDVVDGRFDRVERLQLWTLGVMLTGFAAVLTAVVGIVLRSA